MMFTFSFREVSIDVFMLALAAVVLGMPRAGLAGGIFRGFDDYSLPAKTLDDKTRGFPLFRAFPGEHPFKEVVEEEQVEEPEEVMEDPESIGLPPGSRSYRYLAERQSRELLAQISALYTLVKENPSLAQYLAPYFRTMIPQAPPFYRASRILPRTYGQRVVNFAQNRWPIANYPTAPVIRYQPHTTPLQVRFH